VLRQSVHEVLGSELAKLDITIRLDTTVDTLTQGGRGVTVECTDGRRARYALVVGADGMSSLVRDIVFARQHRPRYTGQMVWRATVSRPADVACRHSYFGPTNKSGFNPISDKQMYVYCVQNVPQHPHWSDAELPAILRGQLAEFGGALGRAREEIRSSEQITCRPVFSAIMPPPWHSGRIVVVGDAAHTTTPHLASGASIVIEDAIVLARLLQSDRPLSAALDELMRQRYERCRMIVENSELLGEWEKNPAAPDQDTLGVIAKSYQALAQSVWTAARGRPT
jgi:2-polyprenyl-6-methoxyphenol hydroxylase-like FAD-dependent oxidoreductase